MKVMLRVPAVTAVLSAFALAACGKDSTSPPAEVTIDQAASMEIAYELMAMIWEIGFGGGLFGLSVHDGGLAAQKGSVEAAEVQTISQTAACPQGGTVKVDGTFTDARDENGAGTVTVDLRQAPSDCGIQTSRGLFRVTGAPELHAQATATTTHWEGPDTITVDLRGGYTWTGPGGQGSCTMDVKYTFNFAGQVTAQVSGTMCGYQVSM